jgi:hypothetical protein
LKSKISSVSVLKIIKFASQVSVADPHPDCHFDADPYPAYRFDADPNPTGAFHFDPDPQHLYKYCTVQHQESLKETLFFFE